MKENVSSTAEKFMHALQALEESREVEPLLGFFSEEATLSRLGHTHAGRGKEATREFWEGYLANFQEIRSEFHSTICGEEAAVLEWESHGKLPGGEEFSYAGVSVLALDEAGLVREFRTYYDSAALERCAA